MFAALKNKLTGTVSKYNGRTDFLEAVCASSALVCFADGSADDKEIAAAIKSVAANPNLAGGFSSRQIEMTMEAMLKRAEGGRVGRSGLYKEIDDVAGDRELAETVLLTALDVADEGGISAEERAILDNIAKRLTLKLADYE